MFDRIDEPAADALHGVMAKYRADPRPHKIDLGVGVYRDESGHSPVMRAVKEAEEALAREEDSKAYQALHGDAAFVEAMTGLVFGPDHPAVRDGSPQSKARAAPDRSASPSTSPATRTQRRGCISACRPGPTTCR
jgi:aspartate/tyrosine/aromatic aminotransferase